MLSNDVLKGADLQGLCRRYGITRLANLAGLDEINVPVWSCVRPASRTVATSFGKGLTDDVAQISALMEALEGACAENREGLVHERGSIVELRKAGTSIVPLENLSRCAYENIPKSEKLDWLKGISLVDGQTVLAPFELVGMDYERRSGPIAPGFHMTSSGLGAGFEWDAAAQHAIFELVEHEVTAMIEESPSLLSFFDAKIFEEGTDDLLDEAMQKFPPELIRPIFREIPNHFGFSVVICELLDREGHQAATATSSMGFACRLDLRGAALAALLEAAQVRTGRIVGAREDIKWNHYKPKTAAATARHREMLQMTIPPLVFSGVAPTLPTTPQSLVAKLRQSGIKNAWIFTLNQPEDPFFVVRVLMDGLEDSSTEVINLGSAAIASLLSFRKPAA
jgi:ribosomal protein S12 methylthiotransferase accessory factor